MQDSALDSVIKTRVFSNNNDNNQYNNNNNSRNNKYNNNQYTNNINNNNNNKYTITTIALKYMISKLRSASVQKG